MLTVLSGTRNQLPPSVKVELANYRYEVFVESLQWQLPAVDRLEFDQFDLSDTLYIIAKDEFGKVCGCARLLPTTRAYLLGELFPELLGGMPPPHAADVWELSRFSTKAPGCSTLSRAEAKERFCRLMAATVQAAIERGASRLITLTALGMERLLRSIELHVHRVGPPKLIDDKPMLALWIELDEQTRRVMGLPQAERSEKRH